MNPHHEHQTRWAGAAIHLRDHPTQAGSCSYRGCPFKKTLRLMILIKSRAVGHLRLQYTHKTALVKTYVKGKHEISSTVQENISLANKIQVHHQHHNKLTSYVQWSRAGVETTAVPSAGSPHDSQHRDAPRSLCPRLTDLTSGVAPGTGFLDTDLVHTMGTIQFATSNPALFLTTIIGTRCLLGRALDLAAGTLSGTGVQHWNIVAADPAVDAGPANEEFTDSDSERFNGIAGVPGAG